MTTPLPVPASPQIPIPVPIVGQPVPPVDFFRRMPGGDTCYVKPADRPVTTWLDSTGAPVLVQVVDIPTCDLQATVPVARIVVPEYLDAAELDRLIDDLQEAKAVLAEHTVSP